MRLSARGGACRGRRVVVAVSNVTATAGNAILWGYRGGGVGEGRSAGVKHRPAGCVSMSEAPPPPLLPPFPVRARQTQQALSHHVGAAG